MGQTEILRLISIAGAFLVGFWLPARLIGYQPVMALEISFDLLISGISMINLYLYFHDSKLSPRTLRSWIKPGPILDVICVLPLSMFAFVVFGQTVEWILLLNLLSVRHVAQIKSFLDRFDSLQPITYRLVPLLIMLPLLVHVVACGWIALGSGSAEGETDAAMAYVKAIYWTFTTLTTVGYGDIVAKSIPQMLYACMTQVAGVGVFGFILSNVAGLLARSDAAREHHMDNLDRIETFMRLHKTPDNLRSKIRTYYHFMWTNKKGYQDNTLLEGLPGKIQSELFMHINRPILDKVEFLRGADPEFLADLMGELKPRVFVPEEKIFRVDEKGDALYFVQSGSVDIITRDGQLVATLHEGSVFGEMALISDQTRSATAQAKTFCDVFQLSRESFIHVMTVHPDFRQNLERVMNERKAPAAA